MRQVQQEASTIKRGKTTRAIYFTNVNTKVFYRKKSSWKRDNCNVVLLYVAMYSKSFPNLALKEMTVKGFKNNYLLHVNNSADSTDLLELPCKKRGRPLLIGEELDEQVKQYNLSKKERSCG